MLTHSTNAPEVKHEHTLIVEKMAKKYIELALNNDDLFKTCSKDDLKDACRAFPEYGKQIIEKMVDSGMLTNQNTTSTQEFKQALINNLLDKETIKNDDFEKLLYKPK